MNLVNIIQRNGRYYSNDTAFIEVRPVSNVRKAIAWGQFSERVNRFANALTDRGINKGDKVFIFGRNSINWLEAYFGVMSAGAWAVPLNFRFTDKDLEFCASVAEPIAFIMEEEYADRLHELRSRLPMVKEYICMGTFQEMVSTEKLIEAASPAPPKVDIEDGDECALYFTSGTTGAPKPVLHLHTNMVCVAINEMAREHWDHRDCLLMLPPFYHLAIGHLLGCILVAGRAVLLTEQINPQYIFENVSREQVTLAFLLVPWVIDILEALDTGKLNKDDYDLSTWRLLYLGAQPIPPSLVQRWKEYFPQMQSDITYGLSETAGPHTLGLGMGNEEKTGSIGKPGPLWDVRLVNDRGEDVPQGEVGEIAVKGCGVMKEYYKNPELTAETIRDGWLHTGDLGKMDEDGFIYLVDRKKDLVISGGENVYPVEVEETIQRYPKVRDVAVIGTPNDRLGEIVTAVIEPVPDSVLTEEEVNSYCEKNLPRYKRPRRIIFDTVPRSPTGKVEKPKLREKWTR
jgi:long-chain acyl-CoA synthetase